MIGAVYEKKHPTDVPSAGPREIKMPGKVGSSDIFMSFYARTALLSGKAVLHHTHLSLIDV